MDIRKGPLFFVVFYYFRLSVNDKLMSKKDLVMARFEFSLKTFFEGLLRPSQLLLRGHEPLRLRLPPGGLLAVRLDVPRHLQFHKSQLRLAVLKGVTAKQTTGKEERRGRRQGGGGCSFGQSFFPSFFHHLVASPGPLLVFSLLGANMREMGREGRGERGLARTARRPPAMGSGTASETRAGPGGAGWSRSSGRPPSHCFPCPPTPAAPSSAPSRSDPSPPPAAERERERVGNAKTKRNDDRRKEQNQAKESVFQILHFPIIWWLLLATFCSFHFSERMKRAK